MLFKLSVVYAECYKQIHYAECRYAECHYAECRYAECHYAEYRGASRTKPGPSFQPGNTKGGSFTVLLTSHLTGLESADNFCFYLQNRLIQTSQTGGQRYSDTSPFSIPCFNYRHKRASAPPLLP